MPEGEPISHAEMIAAVTRRIEYDDPRYLHAAELAAMQAVLAYLERTQWRPIEEAPKDDYTPVDVWLQYYSDGTPTTGRRIPWATFSEGAWRDDDDDTLEWNDTIGQRAQVTHFMLPPLPPSPETPR